MENTNDNKEGKHMKTCKMKKLLALLLAAIMVLSMVACAAKETPAADAKDDQTQADQPAANQDEQTNSEKPAEEVKTIQLWLAGPGKQKDSDMVWEKFNEMLQQYVPNTKVEFTIIPFDNYQEKFNQMLASGEAVDLAWFGWVNGSVAQSAIDGNLMALDDLVSEYGQGIVDTLGQNVIDMHRRADGKLYNIVSWQGLVNAGNKRAYGVPTEFAELAGDTWLEDTRAAVDEWWNNGFTPEAQQKVYDQFDIYFSTLKEAGKLYAGFKPGDCFIAGNQNSRSIGPQKNNVGVIYQDNTFTVKDFIQGDNMRVYAKNMADYYMKGYLRSDIASLDLNTQTIVTGGEFTPDTYVVCAYQTPTDFVKEQVIKQAGMDMSFIDIHKDTLLGLGDATSMVIPYCADEPERAMQVLNALFTEPELYQLMIYGIEGVHYTDNGDGTITTPYGSNGTSDADYGLVKWTIGTCLNSLTTQDDVAGQYEAIAEAEKTAYVSPLLQFSFDSTNVADIVAALDAIDKEYFDMINRGYTGEQWEETLDKWIAERKAAGVDTLIEEFQNQLNAYLEEHNITSW